MMSILVTAAIVTNASPSLLAGNLEQVRTGHQFTEGPVWLADGRLVYSDIPADTIFDAKGDVFRKPSGKSNGLTLDTEGRLIACEHWNRRVTRTEHDGTISVLAESYGGKRLNSPNDAVVHANGTIYFTDPPYGLEGREPEPATAEVYAITAPNVLVRIADDFKKPNGIGLSPDARTLYVADTEMEHIRAFDVANDGAVSGGRVLCDIPHPDGMAIDETGNIWCTARDGVRVIAPDGTLIQTVDLPEIPANCAFGGNDRKTLYITAQSSVYRVRTQVAGFTQPMR